MTYLEFITGICEHPKGWRLNLLHNEIYSQGSTLEEARIVMDTVHMMYRLFSKDPAEIVTMLDSKSDLATAAVQVWLKQ